MHRSVLLALGLAVAACQATAPPPAPSAGVGDAALAGTVTYRQRVALPPDAVAHVRLEDAAGGLVAEETVRANGRQVPLPFALRYDPARVREGVVYTIRAEIRDGQGQTLWTTATPRPVFEDGPEPGPVEVVLTQASADRAEIPTDVRYRLIGFVRDGEAVMLPPGEPLTLTFGDDASYGGAAGCNPYGGEYGSGTGTPTLGQPTSTMQMCPEPSASRDLLAALGGARVEAVRGGTLTLVSRAGERLTFERGDGPWEEARAAGVALRAVGQEPGWTLDVVPGERIELVTGYGDRRVVTPDPGATTEGERTVYHAVTESADLRVVVTPERCRDAMSAAPYPLTVEVTLDGETLSGCGRSLR